MPQILHHAIEGKEDDLVVAVIDQYGSEAQIWIDTAKINPEVVTITEMRDDAAPISVRLTPEGMDALVSLWQQFKVERNNAAQRNIEKVNQLISEAEEFIRSHIPESVKWKLQRNKANRWDFMIDDGYILLSMSPEIVLSEVKQWLARGGLYKPTDEELAEWYS